MKRVVEDIEGWNRGNVKKPITGFWEQLQLANNIIINIIIIIILLTQ